MKLKISDDKKVTELQDKFSECFPGFTIEFFKSLSALKHNDHPGQFLEIGNITKKHKNGEIEIHSSYTARRIASDFKKEFGLIIRINKNYKGNYIPLAGNENLSPQHIPPQVECDDPGKTISTDNEEIVMSLR